MLNLCSSHDKVSDIFSIFLYLFESLPKLRQQRIIQYHWASIVRTIWSSGLCLGGLSFVRYKKHIIIIIVIIESGQLPPERNPTNIQLNTFHGHKSSILIEDIALRHSSVEGHICRWMAMRWCIASTLLAPISSVDCKSITMKHFLIVLLRNKDVLVKHLTSFLPRM